jgi:hypothetical protein
MNARIALTALLLLAPIARAGGFDPRQVPASARWIVHVDLDALSSSMLLRSLHADGVKFENEFDLDDIEQTFGLSPFEDLESLTFYGVGKSGEGSVCIAIGSPALDTVKSKLAAKKPKPLVVGGIDALEIQDHGQSRYIALLPVQSATSRTAVVAPSVTALGTAISTLQKSDAPSLANPRGSDKSASAPAVPAPVMRVRPARGSLVFAACTPVATFEDNATFLDRALGLLCEFADLPSESKDAFALGTRAFEFELAEARDEMVMTLGIDAPSVAKMKELETVLRDAAAKAPLPTDGPMVAARVTKLLAGLRFEALGARLKVSYRYPSKGFVDDAHFIEAARGIRPKN